MDPFNEVEEDCWAQIRALEHFVASTAVTAESKADFSNNSQELDETLDDLKQAVRISESNPAQFRLTSSDIADRKQILVQLQEKISQLHAEWLQRVNNPHRLREVTTMENRISQDGYNPFSDAHQLDEAQVQQLEQQLLDTQDLQLDLIHKTMQSLNQQATLMGSELEDQGFMLDDLDHDMDTVGSKLQRGLRRVNYVIEKNRETTTNCCITLLIVALIALVVLLVVA